MNIDKIKLLKIKNKIYSFIPKIILRNFFGLVAVGERYRPNPFFITVDAIGSDINCIFDHKTKLPFKDNSIRVLYSSHNLEHFPENVADNYFKEAARTLIAGGELLIEVPDCKQYYDAFADYLLRGQSAKIERLTNFDFDESVVMIVRKHQPTENLNLLKGIRAKFSLVIACYCDPAFTGNHSPMLVTDEEFDNAFRTMSMDDFFSWLISRMSPGELASGGHCSAWYPEKLLGKLADYGFSAKIREYKESSRLPSFLVPDRAHRTFGSFRVSGIKH